MNNQQRIFLLLGILLPVVLVCIVWFAKHLEIKKISNPQYDFIYMVKKMGNFKVEVKNQRDLYLTAPKTNYKQNLQYPELYYYNVKDNTSTELNYQKPTQMPTPPINLKIFQIQDYTISTNLLSPDGFRFTHKRTSSVLGIFHGKRSYRNQLIKKNKSLELDIPDNHYYVQFVGWLIPEQGR